MSKLTALSVLLSLSVLSACSSVPQSTATDKKFGHANKYNIAAHAITPDPNLKANTYIPADRERVRAAREAYRKGDVKDPVRQQSD